MNTDESAFHLRGNYTLPCHEEFSSLKPRLALLIHVDFRWLVSCFPVIVHQSFLEPEAVSLDCQCELGNSEPGEKQTPNMI